MQRIQGKTGYQVDVYDEKVSKQSKDFNEAMAEQSKYCSGSYVQFLLNSAADITQ